MVELIIINPNGREKKYSLSKEVISIGRKNDNDVMIQDSEMSRYHASIRFEDGNYYIRDNNSTNGIYFNNSRIKGKQALFPNVRIKLGSHYLIFLGGDKATGPASVPENEKSQTKLGTQPAEEAGEEIQIEEQGKTFFMSADELLRKATGVKLREAKGPVAPDDTEKVNKNLEILYKIGKQLLDIQDIQGISSLLIDTVDSTVKAERIAIQLKDDEGKLTTFEHKVTSGNKNFKLSKTITNKVLNEGVAIMSSNALADDRFASGASIIMQAIRAMMCVPIWKDQDIMGLIYIDNQNSMMEFRESDLQIISAVANQAAIGIDNIRLNENIREELKFRNNLERYHSPDVIDMIMKDTGALGEPREKEATILFSDIQGFTSLSERLSAIQVAEILNEYFDKMSDAIFVNKGTLDKFIGDAIMAIFGAPFSYENDAYNAVRSALDMLEIHQELMAGKPEDRRFAIRIGINTGTVVAGNIGSKKRVDYTVMGDAVNIASRLESKADPNTVYIGESTYNLVKDDFEFREVGPSMLKGKEKSVMVYQVLRSD